LILILILAPPTRGARGHLPHLPSPSYATAYLDTLSHRPNQLSPLSRKIRPCKLAVFGYASDPREAIGSSKGRYMNVRNERMNE